MEWICMDYRLWMPYYQEISRDLMIDPEKDGAAARILSEMLRENKNVNPGSKVLDRAEEIIQGRTVYVLGAGPDLEEELDRLILEKENEGGWKM